MKKIKIWIDLDNSPHVPFFVPILRELEKHGHSITLTARDAFQVCGLADSAGLSYVKIGKHWGANVLLKAIGTLCRASRLAVLLMKEKPQLSISHGSRSLILASAMLRIPTILMFDYEHARDDAIFKAGHRGHSRKYSKPRLEPSFQEGAAQVFGIEGGCVCLYLRAG